MAVPNPTRATKHGQLFGGVALTNGRTSTPPRSGSFLLNGNAESYNTFTVDVKTTGGGTYTVALEGSLDNSTWYTIGTAMTADGVYSQTMASAGINFPFIRGHVTAQSGGTNPTITMNWVAIS